MVKSNAQRELESIVNKIATLEVRAGDNQDARDQLRTFVDLEDRYIRLVVRLSDTLDPASVFPLLDRFLDKRGRA